MNAESVSSIGGPLSVDAGGAFEAIYRKHSAAVLRYAIRCVGRPELAEELTSDAFLALYRNLAGIDQSRLPAWLFTVVRNLAMSHWRRAVVEEKYAVHSEQPPRDSTKPDFMTSILNIAELKPIHRTCLILRYAHDMERTEIAARLGLTENQVKSALRYALKLLRKHFDRASVR